MTEPKYLIWSNYSLDYEDWREDLDKPAFVRSFGFKLRYADRECMKFFLYFCTLKWN